MGRPVMHFEVLGKDGKRLASFYQRLFDWKIDWQDQMNCGVVHTEAGRGIDGGVGAGQDGRQLVTFYVEVDDPDAALKKVNELGGRRSCRRPRSPASSRSRCSRTRRATRSAW